MISRARCWLPAFLAVASTACSTPSGVLLSINSDLGPALENVLVRASRSGWDGPFTVDELVPLRGTARTLPGTYSIQAGVDGDTRPLFLRVTALPTAPSGQRVEQRFRLVLRAGEQRTIPVFLAAACQSEEAIARCAAISASCTAGGACTPIELGSPPVDAGTPDARRTDATADTSTGDSGGGCPGARCGDVCTDTATDVAHCGACGSDCRALPGVRADAVRCVAGRCELRDACALGRADCEASAPGCEAFVNTPEQCGACGVRCSASSPQCVLETASGAPGSQPRYVCASGCSEATPSRCGASCVDTRTNLLHCGLCDRACPERPNAAAACSSGNCALLCAANFGDCDRSAVNGCEASLLTDRLNCGLCGRGCAPGFGCTAGACVPDPTPTDAGVDAATPLDGGACPAGQTLCGTGASARCANLRSDVEHCGSCGNRCVAPENGSVSCGELGGATGCVVGCSAGFMLEAGMCVGQSLRLVAPLSTSVVTRPNPTLRWALGGGADGARVEICRDRACTMLVTGLDAPGDRVAVTGSPLPPGVYYWRVRGRRGSASMFVAGVTATWQFEVPRRFGSLPPDSAYPGRLDVNLDGFSDLVVGAYGAALSMAPTGRAFVFQGNSSGLSPSPNTSLTPPSDNDVFGRFVSALGDVNGDGFGDVGVVSFAASRVLVYHGSPTGIGTAPATTLLPPSGTVAFGSSLAGVGDMNGDGYGDVVVGAPASATAHVFFGSATGLRTTPSIRLAGNTGSRFGHSVAGPGDVNGDGFADVVVGAPAQSFVYAFLSAAPNGITSTTPPVILMGDGQAGDSMAAAGDINADGYPDIIVAQPGNQTARVWRGGSTGFEMSPPPPVTAPAGATGFGGSVAGGSDIDGDGYSDVVIGAPTAARAYVYRGGAFGVASSPNPTLIGTAGSGFGIAVAAPADLDRNTPNFTGDIVVGINSPPSIRVFRGMPPTIFPASDTSISAPFVFSAPAANFGGALGY